MNNCMNCKWSEVIKGDSNSNYLECVHDKVEDIPMFGSCQHWQLREMNHEKEELS